MTLPTKTAIAGAIVGDLVILFFIAMSVQSTVLLFTFWPTSIIGFGYNGGEPVLGFVIGVLEFGGNALIYGVIGWLVGQVIVRIRSRIEV